MRQVFTVVLSTLLFHCISGQTYFQLLVDTVTATNSPVEDAAVFNDGGVACLFGNTQGMFLWRSGPDGAPLFAKKMPDLALNSWQRIAACPDGGVLIVDRGAVAEIEQDIFDLDTLNCSVRITRIEVDGSVGWSKRFSWPLYSMVDGTHFGVLLPHVIVGPSGTIWIVSHASGSESAYHVLSCSPIGEVIASSWFGRTTATGSPTWWNAWPSFLATEAPQGGLYLVDVDNQTQPVGLMKLDSTGSVMWANEFAYQGAFHSVFHDAAFTGDAGQLVVTGQIGIGGNNQYGLGIHVDPDGQLMSAELFAPGNWGQRLKGGASIGGGSNVHLGANEFFVADEDGQVIAGKRFSADTVGEWVHAFGIIRHAVVVDHLVLFGSKVSRHVIFGTTTIQPAIWSIPYDGAGSCGLVDNVYTSYSIPDSIMSLIPHPEIVSELVEAVMETAEFITEDYEPFGVLDHCWTIVDGVVEEMQPELRLLTNCITSGEALVLIGAEADDFTILSSNGSSLIRGRTSGGATHSIPTTRMGPGVYLLRMERDSSGPISLRFVIQ